MVCLAANVFCLQACAAIIGNFDSLDFDSPVLPNNGSFDPPANITVDTSSLYGSTTGSITFNLTGLDVTGDSSANDSASFTFNFSAVGGNLTDTGTGNGNQIGIAGNGAGGLSDPSELLTISYVSGTVTLGDPGTGAAVDFKGFRNMELNGFGAGEEVVISGGTNIDGTYGISQTGTFESGNAFGNVTSFTINAANATDNFSLERLGARIEFQGVSAVPEPSSFALIAIAATGFVARRRRRKQGTQRDNTKSV